MPRALFDPTVDYYRVLGVEPSASDQQIRAAYRRLAKSYHPDLNAGAPVAAARMARVNAAKEVLLHAPTRAAYDASRRLRYGAMRPTGSPQVTWVWTAPASPRPQPATVPTRPPTYVASRGMWLDRWSVGLVLLVAPLVLVLAYYVADAVRISQSPVVASATTYGLAPQNRPNPTVLANAAYQIVVHSPGPSRAAARSVNSIVERDSGGSSPTLDRLRSDSSALNEAADQEDASTWSATVQDLCHLAEHC